MEKDDPEVKRWEIASGERVRNLLLTSVGDGSLRVVPVGKAFRS